MNLPALALPTHPLQAFAIGLLFCLTSTSAIAYTMAKLSEKKLENRRGSKGKFRAN